MNQEFEVIDGIKCFDIDNAEHNNQYPREVFDTLIKIEDNHFWFQARNACISSLIFRFIGTTDEKRFLEIGCGTGVVLNHLKKSTNLLLSGAEIHLSGLKLAKERLPEIEFLQLNATDMPFVEEYDAIGTFDVLEHIEEDELVMKNVARALKPNGLFFISVPQYEWMWSAADDEAFHKRRYKRSELRKKLSSNGFRVLYCGSYLFALFPFMMLSRLIKKKKSGHTYTELEISPSVNFLFKLFMKIDVSLIKRGLQLPFGGSILCVAVKDRM